jgi:hypothetical protein
MSVYDGDNQRISQNLCGEKKDCHVRIGSVNKDAGSTGLRPWSPGRRRLDSPLRRGEGE